MSYGIGDKVRIVKYGHWIYFPDTWVDEITMPLIEKTEGGAYYDMSPYMIGLEALIREVSGKRYAITTKEYGDSAWYNEDQLELVNKNPNNET